MSLKDGILLTAIEHGQLESIQDLLNQNGLDSSGGYDSLCKSIIHKRTEITKLLISSGCRVNSNGAPSNTPLHFAVQNDDEEIIELLLHCNADMEAINEEGLTPLLIAVKMDNERILDFLLKKEFLLNYCHCISPLHVAVEHSLFKMTEKLLQLGVYENTTCKSNEKQTPLHRASKIGDISIVKLLLENGAAVNSKTMDELTPLHFASEKGYVEVIELILSKGADVNACTNNRLTPLYLAVRNSHIEAAKCLMNHGAYINAELKNREKVVVENLLNADFSVESSNINDPVLLHTAIAIGHIQIVQGLINHGLDLEKNLTALHIAAKFKQYEIVKLLLAYGGPVNAVDQAGKTAIYYSTKISDVATTKLLLSYGASVKKNPEILTVATKNVWKEIVEILLQSDIDIEATDENGRTSLHLSVDRYITPSRCYDKSQIEAKEEIAKMLLNMGANVNAKTYKEKVTPLHIACDGGSKNFVQLLLKCNADVNCVVKEPLPGMYRTEYGDTALHIVARAEDTDILEILLQNGAEVCSENNEGATPLHLASHECCPETISLLLKYGSPIDSRDIHGQTPLFIAAHAGRTNKILELLINAGSDINILSHHNKSAFDIFDQSCFGSKEEYLEYICDDEFARSYKQLRFHLITLKTANLYIREELLLYMSTGDESTILHKKRCEAEIEELKLETIANNKLNLYDILTKNIHSLANYARNEDIIRFFKTNQYTTKFPIYGPIIKRNFAKGTERCVLLERAQEFAERYFTMPYQCTDHILRYLSNADLENLINITNTPSTVKL